MLRLFIAMMFLGASAGQAASADRYPSGQLETDVTPTHYTIDLTVVPDQETFTGKVMIDVKFDKPTDLIWLHGRDLKVTSAQVIDAGGAVIAATWSEIPDSDGVVRLALASPARGPSARISVTYTAPFNKQLEGLYRSQDGGDFYAFTQMEPISARYAFPSFDDPRFKTPYDISLTVREAHAAISNTPYVKLDALPGEMKRVQFATSKPLPTYLIAFAVGPFDVVDWAPIAKTAVRDREIPLRGIANKGKGARLKFALENTEGLLLAMEDYFGTPYPYEKLDIIAATDFAAGAMENAGAIVYREGLLLMDEDSSLSQKRRYVTVHAHELAHQWFGNLVTPVWWNDIWLNEAFATWMATKIAATWDPKGEYDRMTLQGALSAMSTDSRSNARRIAQPIESNDDIDNAFDSITYEKGGGVLSMFEQYYGVEAFRKGVKLHLDRHAWGNATAKDFLQSITDANSDTKGVAAFETFLNEPGVPMLSTRLSCSGKTPSVSVTQARYLPGPDQPALAKTQLWKVPLCVSYGQGSERSQTCSVIENRINRVDLPGGSCPAWVMPNADGAGYYRFSLDQKGWSALTASVNSLTDKEVLALLDSLEAAFDGGELDVADYLDHVKTIMSRKGDSIGWDAAGSPRAKLTWIKDELVSEKSREAARGFIAGMYEPLYEKIGLDPTSAFDRSNPTQATLLRAPVVNMVAIQGRSPAARQELAKRAAAYLGIGADGKSDGRLHPEALDANLMEQALGIAVQDMGAPVVEAIFAFIKTERDGTVRSRLIGALMHTTDPAMAARVRALALSDDLRVNEIPIVVYGSMSERANVSAGWAWFKDNFDAIKIRMPGFGQGGLAGIGRRFCSARDRNDFKRFFEPKVGELTGAPRIFAGALENIDRCIALVEKQRLKADRYFAQR
jgi:alanyl aminopeptidase